MEISADAVTGETVFGRGPDLCIVDKCDRFECNECCPLYITSCNSCQGIQFVCIFTIILVIIATAYSRIYIICYMRGLVIKLQNISTQMLSNSTQYFEYYLISKDQMHCLRQIQDHYICYYSLHYIHLHLV